MNQPPRIHAEDVHRRLDAGEQALIIDVRSAEEYRTAHAAGAILLPQEQVNAKSLAACMSRSGHAATTTPLYFICHSGRRATDACADILEHFPSAAVIEGGTLAWAQAGLPIHQGEEP